jgi:hypothetical protein
MTPMSRECGMTGSSCSQCRDLVHDIQFSKWDEVCPPHEAGLYAIRVAERGSISPAELLAAPFLRLLRSRWKKYEWVCDQVALVTRIEECDIIYVGCAKCLSTRFGDLSWGQHPAAWPVAALLCSGWELEYGWRRNADYRSEENGLKEAYKARHSGNLPALMKR